MCLAIPAKICEFLEENRVMVDISGVKREADTSLISEDLAIGDYLLLHTGFAIAKLDHQQAQDSLKVWDQIAELTLESDIQ